jgi:hypothetical protein
MEQQQTSGELQLSQEDSKPTFTFEQSKHHKSSDNDTRQTNANKIHAMFKLVREASGNLKEENVASECAEVHQIRVIFFRHDTTEFRQADLHPQGEQRVNGRRISTRGSNHTRQLSPMEGRISKVQECMTELDLIHFTNQLLFGLLLLRSFRDQSFDSWVSFKHCARWVPTAKKT